MEQDSAVLIVSGSTTLSLFFPKLRLDLSGGVGVVLDAGESYSLASERGAVAIAINATGLRATAEAISTPERVMGQLWPVDADRSARIFRFPK